MANLNPVPPGHVSRSMLLQPPHDPKYIIVRARGGTGNWDSSAGELFQPFISRTQPTSFTKLIPSLGQPRFATSSSSASLPAVGPGNRATSWLRNGVGIVFSQDGKGLWEVENVPNNAHWQGVDVYNNNPAEELNKVPLVGRSFSTHFGPFYGYPHCFATWSSAGITSTPIFNFQPGQHPLVEDLQVQHTDAWCNNPNNVVKPFLLLEPHSAPLGRVFYDTASHIQPKLFWSSSKVGWRFSIHQSPRLLEPCPFNRCVHYQE
ncbi:hypothetical protein FRC08_012036 [Ceratobasidium sp. 394]|nr:hypothetical protein FRC08_012036 [Ceratobasidium sp. 394]